jgi:hypothetical protein
MSYYIWLLKIFPKTTQALIELFQRLRWLNIVCVETCECGHGVLTDY